MNKIIYVDMDGVLADFDSAKAAALAISEDIKHPQCQMDFFRSLPPIFGGIDACKALLGVGYDVYLLTSPSIRNPLSYTEKMLWVKDNFGVEWVHRLIISKHKHLNKGDFLIDDRPYANGADKFEGELIHFGSEEFKNWNSVLKYFI